ncbi:MAG TPA: siderophore-interacting protein [Actinocrinis sp.]|nr:siderophore-interacting protein [Actinocrinis sp.]
MTATPDSSPQGPQTTRRRLGDRFMLQAAVASVDRLSRTMRRIRLDVGGRPELEWTAGQQIRIQVGTSGAMDWLVGQLRTYSVWDLDAQRLDLVALDHGEGPGASWIRHAEPGQVVRFLRPQGSFVLRPGAAEHVFIGEETAAVAFGAMLRALPAEQRSTTVLEIDSPDDQIPLPGPVRWHYRSGRSAAQSASLVEAVRAADLPASGVAYVAGEARTIQMVRKHLVDERGWSRRDVITKPFWTPGKKGLE